ncbi:MAG: MBL fold metallo-hydrolase [Elusimicrobiota bacterium]
MILIQKKYLSLFLLIFTLPYTLTPKPCLYAAKYMRVYYIDWNAAPNTNPDYSCHGDSIFIELPGVDGILGTSDDKRVVVDGGSYDTASKSRWDEFLNTKNISQIDYMVLSHPHADHIVGLFLIADITKVSYLYANTNYSSDSTSEGGDFITLKSKISADGGQIVYVDPGDILSGPGTNKPSALAPNGWDPNVSVKVVAANETAAFSGGYPDYNAQSVIFTLRFGTSSFMFGGDAKRAISSPENYGEGQAVSLFPSELKIDIYKVHHHGDYNAYDNTTYFYNSPQFLDYVLPKWCISQDGGKPNVPDWDALERFKSYGTKIYRNDLDGHVLVKCDDAGNYDIVREMMRADDDPYSTKFTSVFTPDWLSNAPKVPADLKFYQTFLSSVTLSWTAVARHSGGIVNYDVYAATVSNGDSGAGIGVSGFTPTSNAQPYSTGIYRKINNSDIPGDEAGKTITYTVTDLSPAATHYFFRVASIGTSYYYEHRYSNEADGIPPGKVNEISATPNLQTEGSLTLSWTVPGGNGYFDNFTGTFYIQNTTDLSNALKSDFWNPQQAQEIQEVTNLSPGSTYSKTLYGLTPGVTYYIRLWSKDQSSNFSAMSSGVTSYASPPVTPNNVYAYPNPFTAKSGVTYITFKNLTKYAKINIFNIAGELIYETEKNDYTIEHKWDTKNNSGDAVASGTYIYTVTDDAGRNKTGKFQIIR